MFSRTSFRALAFLQALIVFFSDLTGLLLVKASRELFLKDPITYYLNLPTFENALAGVHRLAFVATIGFFAFYLAAEGDTLKKAIWRSGHEVGD